MTTRQSAHQVEVLKTIKLFMGGQFVRSESGRTFSIERAGSKKLYANVCQASRKDLRNAVTSAKSAEKNWGSKSAFNRSQILYRTAEMLEGKREELLEALAAANGDSNASIKKEIQNSIDAWVYYAGFADKFSQVAASTNPVSGPFFNFTSPENLGTVAIACNARVKLDTWSNRVAAALCSGNTVVALLPPKVAPALGVLGETFATSDYPAGAINLLSGFIDELSSHIGSHLEIDGIAYIGGLDKVAKQLKIDGVRNMKRISIGETGNGLKPILDFVEQKTVWHPQGY